MGGSRGLIHELRNALNSMLFAVEFLPGADPADAAEALEIIERQADQGAHAAEQLELLAAE